MRIFVRTIACAAAIALLAPLGACSKKQGNSPPVATPSLTLDTNRLPIGSVARLTYRFQVEPNTHIDRNYRVFVHVLDADGEQMWTDDHLPPTPTSAWQPGQTVEYTRTIVVPNYPYIGEATIRVGLYDETTGERLALEAQDAGRREYTLAKLQILPSSENVALLNKDGWHQSEVDSRDPSRDWQWTGKTATIEFRNPKKNATLYLQYDARTDQFNPPQQVTMSIGGQTIATFPADARNSTLKTVPITAAQMGTGDTVDLEISVDRTFKPGGGDPRELGIRVYHTYLDVK